MGDPKAKDTVSFFFSEWLGLEGLAAQMKDPVAYPNYTPAVEQAMLSETSTFVQNVAFGGDGRLATFLGASYSYLNSSLGAVLRRASVGHDLRNAHEIRIPRSDPAFSRREAFSRSRAPPTARILCSAERPSTSSCFATRCRPLPPTYRPRPPLRQAARRASASRCTT